MNIRLFAALSILVLCGGCGRSEPEEPERPAISAIVLSERATGLAPERGDGPFQATLLLGNVSRGLVTLDGAGQVVPALAESWRVSEDGLSIIFRLRKDQWSDGRPITGSDIVRLFRTVLAPSSRHPFKPYLQVIENGDTVASGRMSANRLGVSSPMSDIVEIRLQSPRPALLVLLARPEMALSERNLRTVSAGPFTLSQKKDGTLTWLLSHNPKYHDHDAVQIGSVETVAEPDARLALARFKKDRLALLLGGTTGNYPAARAAAVDRFLHVDPALGVYGYRAARADGLAGDTRLRQALSMTIDRDAIARQIGAPQAVPLFGVTPLGAADIPQPGRPDWWARPLADRLEEARRLIAALRADKSLEEEIVLKFMVPEDGDRDILATIARNWAGLGIRIEPVLADDRTADFALYESIAPADLGSWFLRPFECSRNGYCNEKVDDLLTRARSAHSPAERSALLAEADRLLVADHAFLPVITPVRWSLVDTSIVGWTDNAEAWHPLDTLSVMQSRRRFLMPEGKPKARAD